MWRNTAATPRIGPVQAGTLLPVSVWALHISKPTFAIALTGVLLFWFLERRGWTPLIMWRRICRNIAGPFRPVSRRVVWRRRSVW